MGLFSFGKSKEQLKSWFINQYYNIYNNYQPIYQAQDFSSQVKDGYAGNPYVYSCVKLIADAWSTVPIKVAEVKDTKALKGYNYYKNQVNSKELRQLKEKTFEDIESHPLLDLLYQPNPLQSGSSFIKSFAGFKYITGNGYIEGAKPTSGINAGKITQMYVLPSQLIEIVSGGRNMPVAGYKLNTSFGKEVPIDADMVMHSKLFNPEYGDGQELYGLSPLQAAAKTLTVSNNAFKSRNYTFENMGIAGILTDRTGSSITPEEAKEIQNSWQRDNGGVKSHGKIKVTSANLDWLSMGLSPVDMNIIESLRMDKADIALCYQIPLELLNEKEGATFTNRKEAAKQFYIKVIIPGFNEFIDELNRWLAPGYSKDKKIQLYAQWDSIPELQQDFAEMANQLNTAWWLTPNEKRKVMDYAPLDNPDMDEIWKPTNIVLDQNGNKI